MAAMIFDEPRAVNYAIPDPRASFRRRRFFAAVNFFSPQKGAIPSESWQPRRCSQCRVGTRFPFGGSRAQCGVRDRIRSIPPRSAAGGRDICLARAGRPSRRQDDRGPRSRRPRSLRVQRPHRLFSPEPRPKASLRNLLQTLRVWLRASHVFGARC